MLAAMHDAILIPSKSGRAPAAPTIVSGAARINVDVAPVIDLYSFQPRAFWDHLVSHGASWPVTPGIFTLAADARDDGRWPYAYEWMVSRMLARGIRNDTGLARPYPIWTWFWWAGCHMKKPNLSYKGPWDDRGKDGCVFLHLRVPREDVLISNYDTFHTVINHHYLATSEEEDAAFDARLIEAGHDPRESLMALPQGDLRAELEHSWERIFDLEAPADDWHNPPPESRYFQATLFSLRLDQVAEAWWLPPRGGGRKARLHPCPAAARRRASDLAAGAVGVVGSGVG